MWLTTQFDVMGHICSVVELLLSLGSVFGFDLGKEFVLFQE
jgi:hypothetical protein